MANSGRDYIKQYEAWFSLEPDKDKADTLFKLICAFLGKLEPRFKLFGEMSHLNFFGYEDIDRRGWSGYCSWDNNGKPMVWLNVELFRGQFRTDFKSAANTMLHELAHAFFPEGEGHSEEWRDMYIYLSSVYGFTVTGSEYDLSQTNSDAIGERRKGHYWCACCDMRSFESKKSGKLTCPRCSYRDGTISELRWDENGINHETIMERMRPPAMVNQDPDPTVYRYTMESERKDEKGGVIYQISGGKDRGKLRVARVAKRMDAAAVPVCVNIAAGEQGVRDGSVLKFPIPISLSDDFYFIVEDAEVESNGDMIRCYLRKRYHHDENGTPSGPPSEKKPKYMSTRCNGNVTHGAREKRGHERFALHRKRCHDEENGTLEGSSPSKKLKHA